MTGEDRRNYLSIVSKRWKKIKEDPERLIECNNRAQQMKDKAKKVKTAESENDEYDLSVDHMVQHEEKVTKKVVLTKYRHNSKMHQSLQSLLTQTQRTQVTMMKTQNL